MESLERQVPFPDLYRRTDRWKWPIFDLPLPFLSRLLSFSIKDTAKQGWEESGERNFSPAIRWILFLFLSLTLSIAADFPYLTRLPLVPHRSEMGGGGMFQRTCNRVIRNVTPFRCRFQSHKLSVVHFSAATV